MSGASTFYSFGLVFIVLKIDKRKKNLLLRRTTTWVDCGFSTILFRVRTTQWILAFLHSMYEMLCRFVCYTRS